MEQPIYFKITNFKEKHYGFQYQNGLNVLDKPFQEEGSCVPGGLYFTTIEHIPDFYQYGIYLREITVPTTDPDFKIVQDSDGNKYRANKIILEKRHSLFDPITYEKFGLDIKQNKYLVDFASQHGNLDFLVWWSKSGISLEYTTEALDWASVNGHIEILNWWLNSGLELRYSLFAMDGASFNGSIKSLNWWIESDLEMRYSDLSIEGATLKNNLDVLEWWKYNHSEKKVNMPCCITL